ncbi:manganese transporter SMF1 [Rhizoctonia solani]|uniref:Manganese transporter SMF1 n=1 Tax=Rhizoctonia solani TaxID=456999 RepID=A0A8H8NUB0_9AGAM|nr:manganese transporter SMF1 [Rhizoctonia solani]QRW18458.1 manganese transporter SMF1 [Rhizoctonia solani]
MVGPPPSPLRIIEVPAMSARGESFTQTVAIDEQKSSNESLSTPEGSDDASYQDKIKKNLKNTSLVVLHHMKHHVGPGILASIAYFDPGNWAVDLQAGSQFGYKLLFVILLAGLGAVLLQTMAARLGCVTGRDLAEHCRILLYNRPKHKLLYRRLLLYPIGKLTLLGSAIGLTLLVPSLPLWASVVITSFDVIFVLAIAPSSNGRPVRLFEANHFDGSRLRCLRNLYVLLIKIKPNAGDVIVGYLPSKTLFQSGALYTSIGILGATVVNATRYFPGSSLATLDRVSSAPPPLANLPAPNANDQPVTFWQKITKFRKSMIYVERKPPKARLRRCRLIQKMMNWHLRQEKTIHRVEKVLEQLDRIYWRAFGACNIDIVMSLLGFAVVINSAILILAAAAFFYSGRSVGDAGLFDAYDLIQQIIGKPAAIMFAVALLCSGQSASITATLAGQIVSEGFIEWRISPLLRRVITRLIGLVPSTVVAVTVGRQGIDVLLVASQVALSIVLPFVIFPLVYLTSQESIMQVAKPEGGTTSYKSSIVSTVIGYLIFAVVIVANAMVTTGALCGQAAWSPRPGGAFNARKRYALQLVNQVKSIGRRQEPKRKRAVTYSSSDTEDEPSVSFHSPKRVCHKDIHSKLDNDETPLRANLWEEGTSMRPRSLADELFFHMSHEERHNVERARSSEEPIQEMDLNVSPTSPDDDLFDNSSASSYEDRSDEYQFMLYEKPDMKRFVEELPSLLKRRYRNSVLVQRTHWIDDEPLRVKFLNRQFKHRLRTGDFTDSQLREVLEQRPIYGTFGDMGIPTPQVVPISEDLEPEDLDLADAELHVPERPSTPMPDSDSSSDSDSDDSDTEVVYGAGQVCAQLTRREMEAMGIYDEEEYEYESEDEQ